ncbi:tetratricopeptide repeat protein [bacterium]|nr:tetratricopeptide repeat protein [candidate division CSSED10-310 bacterium]
MNNHLPECRIPKTKLSALSEYAPAIPAILLALAVSIARAGYYQDAYDAYNARNYQDAIQILEEGIAAAPNDEQLSNLLGQTYFVTRQYDKAIDVLKKTILLDPEIDSAYYLLGLSCMLKTENGQSKPAWFEASQAFQQAVQLKPDEFKYLYNLGHSLLELKKYQQALEPLQNAYNTDKGAADYKTVLDLALAYQLTDQKDKAITYLEKAHELDPSKYQPLKYLGNLYLEKELYDEVTSLGKKLTVLQPDLSSGYLFKGVGHLQAKEYSSARSAFEKAIEKDPKDALAHYHLGLALEGLLGPDSSSFSQLINAYGKAVSLAQDAIPPDWYYRLGHAYELEAHLDWERAVRNVEARARCLRNLRMSRDAYLKAGSGGSARERLEIVNEQIRQLEVIG